MYLNCFYFILYYIVYQLKTVYDIKNNTHKNYYSKQNIKNHQVYNPTNYYSLTCRR